MPFYLPASVGMLWLWSGLQPILTARQASLDLLARVGVAEAWQMPLLAAASLLDVCFGIGCCSALRHARWFWLAQLATVAAYSAVIAFRLPEFWLHPFAPLLKNLPVMALMWFLFCANKEP